MALLAVIIPLLMLGVVLLMGRIEELLLPPEEARGRESAGMTPAPAAVAARETAGTPTA
ncbi:hypothetical protein ABZY20_11835 [Streptomyces sp. NPDC006624]|uniref:hypothetical protein n=1 Tax=unclassified Streptomyces TaxID=2593676 RepID=UPI0033A21D45